MRILLVSLAICFFAQDPDPETPKKRRLADVFPPVQRVSLEAKDGKLKDVLRELRQKTGLRMEFDDLEDVPVTIQVKDATVLEAITAIGKATGLGFHVGVNKPAKGAVPSPPGSPPGFWFRPGEFAETPRRFNGHFMLEVTRVTLERRTRFDGAQRSGRLSLMMWWPPGVRPDTALIDVASVADDKGTVLFERRSFGQSIRGPMWVPGQVIHFSQADLDIKHPADGASALVIKGSALILLAGEDRYITFEATEGSIGQKKEMADMTAEFRGVKTGDETIVIVAYKGQPKSPLPESGRLYPGALGLKRFLVRLEDGTTVESNKTGESHDGPFRVMRLCFQSLPSKIKSVEVLAETVYHEERFDFEFKDIPLPK